MKTLLVCLCVYFVFFSVALGQERTDVIYLKNGDIRKGTIIENVPNDYIKVETADGSIYTIKYADIEKMTKEVKPARATTTTSSQPLALQPTPSGLMARTSDLGISIGVWLTGTVNYDKTLSDANDPKKNTGFIARVFYDGYVAEKFAVGAFASFSPISWEQYSQTSTEFEVGISLKARFPLGDGSAVIKPGVEVGYRHVSSETDQATFNGMALNLGCEFQFTAPGIVPFVEIGIISQPAGGNDIDDIDFPPIPFITAGVAF